MENRDTDLEAQLLSIIREFISEFKTERVIHLVTLDASLERDLGIDSLGRVELFLRLEKGFGVALPETAMSEAEYVRDLVNAIQNAHPAEHNIVRDYVSHLDASRTDPSGAETLVDALIRHATLEPNRPHIYLQDEKGVEQIIRYGDLLEESRKVAAGLAGLGLKKQQTVAIMLPTCEAFFQAFFGVLLAGGIPIPIYPPFRPDKIEEYAVRAGKILNNAEVRFLITFTQIETLGKLLRVFINSLQAVTTVEELKQSKHRFPHLSFDADDSAMIQYTSGSTSDPKGVLLSHRNLLANVRSVAKAINLTSSDVGVSWLPLYHDMGLIGAWFSALYSGFPVTIMSPLTFLTRPERWLWAIHFHRGTLSAGPNFAYELCVRKIREEDIEGLDLSSWRLAFNGAEAINPRTLERFVEKFSPYGFKKESIYPVYGLAESSVALTFPPINRGAVVDTILREPFEREGRAEPAEPGHVSILEFVNCGSPLPEHDIRIVDDNGHELPERQVGTLHFTGPSSMQGYYHNPDATRAIYRDGWWDSGDLAYIADGEVYITGRKKDIIIKAGRNLYPQEIEEVVSQVSGVRKGCVVAFGTEDLRWGTEKLVIIAETSETNAEVRDKIITEVIERVSVVIGIPPDEVCLIPPRSIPKTSSGKLQRSACKKLYEEGKLTKKGLPASLQMFKLFLRSAFVSVTHYLGKFARILYTAYMALLFLIIFPITWLGILVLPAKPALKFGRSMVRLLLGLGGIRVVIEGKENLKKYPSMIFVSNHASYLDSLVLVSILPLNALFVGKKELETWPMVRTAIRKFGFITVDRMDFSKNLSEVDTISDALHKKHSILIFPEGTFTYATGLRPFKLGAFKVAVDTQTPICPIALQGTRHILRGGSALLGMGSVKVNIGTPIVPSSTEWSEVMQLHSKVRADIAQHCGELMLDMITAGPAKE